MLSTILLALAAALLGAAFCFVGYRFFLVMLPILGFFAGFWIGAEFVALFMSTGLLATTLGFVVGLLVGLLGAALAYVAYLAGVLLVATAFGGALGAGVMHALGFGHGLATMLVTAAAAFGAAALTVKHSLQRYVIIVFTAVAGAVVIAFALMLLFGHITPADLEAGSNLVTPVFQGSWFWSIAWVALTVAGIVVQIRTTRDFTFSREMYAEGWG